MWWVSSRNMKILIYVTFLFVVILVILLKFDFFYGYLGKLVINGII